MYTVRVRAILRVPALGSSGLLTASNHSTWPAAMFSIVTLMGSNTAIVRVARLFKSSRIAFSSTTRSMVLVARATPMWSQNARKASGV